jgi:hypothetical protein
MLYDLLKALREDLKFQLNTTDEIDWDYFVEMAREARDEANRIGLNMVDK